MHQHIEYNYKTESVFLANYKEDPKPAYRDIRVGCHYLHIIPQSSPKAVYILCCSGTPDENEALISNEDSYCSNKIENRNLIVKLLHSTLGKYNI